MRLVPTCGTGNNQVLSTQVEQSIRLQARFLQYTETSWIKAANSAAVTQCPLYNTLRAMTLPLSQDNQARKPLFHAVSPSLTKDGYLVRYLPQYRAPVQAALARLYNQPTAIPASPISPPITSTDPSIPSPCEPSRGTSSTEAVFQGIWSRFNTPCPFSRPPRSNFSAHPMTISPTPSPSHYKLFPWLAALLQKSQDTAWDRWRYRNGVL